MNQSLFCSCVMDCKIRLADVYDPGGICLRVFNSLRGDDLLLNEEVVESVTIQEADRVHDLLPRSDPEDLFPSKDLFVRRDNPIRKEEDDFLFLPRSIRILYTRLYDRYHNRASVMMKSASVAAAARWKRLNRRQIPDSEPHYINIVLVNKSALHGVTRSEVVSFIKRADWDCIEIEKYGIGRKFSALSLIILGNQIYAKLFVCPDKEDLGQLLKERFPDWTSISRFALMDMKFVLLGSDNHIDVYRDTLASINTGRFQLTEKAKTVLFRRAGSRPVKKTVEGILTAIETLVGMGFRLSVPGGCTGQI